MYLRLPRIQCILFFLAGLFLLASCQSNVSDSPFASYPEQIKGSWQLTTAYRNEQETRVLDGTFFNFTEGQVLETNLPLTRLQSNDKLTATYSFVADSLILSSATIPVQKFHITLLDSQYLIMSTMIQNQDFRFDLERQ